MKNGSERTNYQKLTLVLNNFYEFIQAVESLLSCGHWLYRGINNASLDLLPTLSWQGGSQFLDKYDSELAMIRETFSDNDRNTAQATSDFRRLLLAQHHGAPTRLLDWTTSALVAAFFASDGHPSAEEFKIIAVHVCPQADALTRYNVRDFDDVDFYTNYATQIAEDGRPRPRRKLHNLLKNEGIIFVKGGDLSPRITAQQGYVSLQHELDVPLDRQPSDSITEMVDLVFPESCRNHFQETLYQLGVRKRTLFPELATRFGSFKTEREIAERLFNRCTELPIKDSPIKLSDLNLPEI